MLKVAVSAEEQRGAAAMVWYGGIGAARILEHDGAALVMERLEGPLSLPGLARAGADDEVVRIICGVAAALHRPCDGIPAFATPLDVWFKALSVRATTDGGLFARSHAVAQQLLSAPREITLLHGDLHHANVLHGGDRGWLAIDPKGVWGERGYDFANIFFNPDGTLALQPGRLEHRLGAVSEASGVERARLLAWVAAYAGLSAAWSLEDGGDPQIAFAIGEQALGLMT